VTADLRRTVALGAAQGATNYGVDLVAPDTSVGGIHRVRQEILVVVSARLLQKPADFGWSAICAEVDPA
jgi:hypothetical protein